MRSAASWSQLWFSPRCRYATSLLMQLPFRAHVLRTMCWGQEAHLLATEWI